MTTVCKSPTQIARSCFTEPLRVAFLAFLTGCYDEGGRDDVRSCAPPDILLVTNSPPAGDPSALRTFLVA